jgi:hypothetical protein
MRMVRCVFRRLLPLSPVQSGSGAILVIRGESPQDISPSTSSQRERAFSARGVRLRCGATGASGRCQPFLPTPPQLTRAGVNATVGRRRYAARVVICPVPSPACGCVVPSGCNGVSCPSHPTACVRMRARGPGYGPTTAPGHPWPGAAANETRPPSLPSQAPRSADCRPVARAAGLRAEPARREPLLSLLLAEQGSNSIEALGSVPKMCIMLSAARQAPLEAGAQRTL